MSRRFQMLLLLVVSVLLHAALFFALSRIPPPDRRAAVAKPLEWEVVPPEERPVPPPLAQRPAPPSQKTPRRAERPPSPSAEAPAEAPAPRAERRSTPVPEARPSRPTQVPEAHAEGPSEPDAPAPLAQDVPRASPPPDLVPPGLLGGGLLKGPPSTGRTLRNTGEVPDPKALAARQAEEARQRVDGWAQDAAATARASGGVVHPYFAKLQKGFAKQLVDPPALDLKLLASRAKREQVEAIQRFGKTGSPGVSEPRDLRLETRNRMQAAVEAGRAANMYMVDVTAPVLALAAIVEVRQARDGKLLELKVLEGSGDAKFDVWAVSQLKEALAVADPPQEGTRGAGIHDDGMASRWRLEEYLGNPRVQIHLIGIY